VKIILKDVNNQCPVKIIISSLKSLCIYNLQAFLQRDDLNWLSWPPKRPVMNQGNPGDSAIMDRYIPFDTFIFRNFKAPFPSDFKEKGLDLIQHLQ